MSDDGRDPKTGRKGRAGRIRFGRRPAWLIVLVLLVLVVLGAYQISLSLGVHDRESFFNELWGVLGIVLLFLLGGAALGLLMVAIRSWQRRQRGPRSWGNDEADDRADDDD